AEADRAMRQYASLRPDDFPRRRGFAEALAGAGQLDPAIRHYQELLASSSAADADLLRALAQLHERAGNPHQALQLYLRAIDGPRPPDPELHLKAARLYRRTSRPEESLRWYRSYLDSAADPVGRNMAGTELAEALLDAGDPAAALAQARSVQAEAPMDAASLLIAARAASQSNQPRLAAGYLEALGELRPLARAEKTWLAGQLRAAGNAQEALILYNRILVEGPSADPEILEAAGDLRADSGDFAGALKAYLQLQSLEPDPRRSAKIAWVAAGAGQIDSAGPAYSDYLQARPDDVGVRLDAARFLAASGNFGRAIEYYERVVSLRGPEGLRLELALSCLGARRYGDAETWAREALQHGEREDRSRITLAQSLHLQGNSREADRVLREMLIPTPQRPEATAWLARVAMALDRHLESFRLSERALHLGASEPGELWMLHGEAARKRADYGRARAALERAAGAGFDPVRLNAARENLRVGLRPSASVPFSINEDSNELLLAQAGISALLRLTPGIPLTAQFLIGELKQRGARFTRTAGMVAIPQVFVTPELGLHLRAGMEDYRSGGSLFVWEAGGRYFFRDTSEIGVSGLRESLWSGYDRREPREFNRVTGLEALGPDFHVHTVRAYIDKASGGGRRLRLESGASGYQDGNDRVFLYGHYQVPLSDRAGNWTVVAPNLYFETFTDRSPSYFSPDRFVTLGGMLHTIRRAPDNRWRVEGEVNPRLVSSDGRQGFGIHAVLDFSVLAGPVELGAGGFVFYEELNDYWLWRISGGIRVPVGRTR
ncbi:MAG: tetratricopeptide repeat protein, partial [Acidobacteriota bacterium]